MQLLDISLVSIILLGAALYLYKTLRPRRKGQPGCGCGSVDCKVPKPKFKQ